jgi:serine/threonine-protein kinase
VHRDIKPSNIFLSRDLKPKLLDFGTALAPVAEPAPKGTRQLVGTPNYMSPEQARGEALDARSDIFSVGTILYELLAGRRAFDGRTVDETLDRVMDAVPKSVEKIRPDTPPALAQIVRKAMSPSPADRYQKASELRNALAEFVDGSRPASVDSSRAAATPPAAAPAPSRGPLLFGLALLALLGVGGIALFMPGREQAPAAPEVATPVPIIPPMAPPPPPAEAAPSSPTPNGAEAARSEGKTVARKRVEPAPIGDGTVTVAVAPWGEVVVNGAVQGVSPPLTQITLPPGLHTIEIRNGSFEPFVARVELKPGEKIHLQHRF